MAKYMLDTNALIWLLNGSDRLQADMREDIEYFLHPYAYNRISILEILHLQQRGKIDFRYSAKQIFSALDSFCIGAHETTVCDFEALERIPILKINGTEHADMFDRMIIASAIAGGYTLVSADLKFPFYRQFGLSLIEL